MQIIQQEDCTHIAVIGTYNKLWAIVRYGEELEQRIKTAIEAHLTTNDNLEVLEIDMKKKMAVTQSDSRYQSKLPFSLNHYNEF